MAETKQNTKKLIPFMLPLDKTPKASQEVYVSVNFKNYIIKRGVKVELPEEVIEVLQNADMAELEAMNYEEEQKAKQNRPIEA